MLDILQDNNNVGNICRWQMNVDDKSGNLMTNTGDLAQMGEPLIIVTASSILDIGREP